MNEVQIQVQQFRKDADRDGSWFELDEDCQRKWSIVLLWLEMVRTQL